jgi:hypothetical protein
MERRSVLRAVALATVFLVPTKARAVSLIDLKGLGNAIDAAADALGKLADSLAHAVSLGDKGYSVVRARVIKSTLKDIDARLTDLAQTTQSALVQNMHGYVELARRMIQATGGSRETLRAELRSSWKPVVDGIRDVLTKTKNLLNELRQDRSDFVLEDARGALLSALDAKVGLLDTLRFGEFPEDLEQINQLRIVADKFDVLRHKTIEALTQMSKYIAKIES